MLDFENVEEVIIVSNNDGDVIGEYTYTEKTLEDLKALYEGFHFEIVTRATWI